MVFIKQLSSHLATHLKTVRLNALQDTPLAFGSTYANESRLSDEDWLKRTAAWNSDRSVCYIAIDRDNPCGIAAGKLHENDPHHADLVSMWVAPTHRRTGLGARLVEAVQQWARNLGVNELHLMVTSENTPAISFYKRCGFTFTGMTEPYPNDPALFEYEMVKSLHNS
jgi:ribosomal protein S18 acetylase RimI-like enzyme